MSYNYIKKRRLCTKYSSGDVVRVNGAHDRIPKGIFARARLDCWVCCKCGYCELWADKADLDKIREFWREPPDERPPEDPRYSQ